MIMTTTEIYLVMQFFNVQPCIRLISNMHPSSFKTKQNALSLLSKLMNGFHTHLSKEQIILESKAQICSSITYCTRDYCSKFEFFFKFTSLCFKWCDTIRLIPLFKVSVCLIRYTRLDYLATKLYEHIEVCYVPCKMCQLC